MSARAESTVRSAIRENIVVRRKPTSENAIASEYQRYQQALDRVRMLIDVKKYDHALQEAQQALTLEPNDPTGHWLAGVCYGSMNQHGQAIHEAREAIRLRPEFAQAYRLLASVAFNRKRWRDGLKAIDQAIRISPGNADYLSMRALLQLNSGKSMEALKTAKEALQLAPESVMANQVLTIALVKLGHRQEAKRSAVKTLAQSPDDAIAWYQRGVQLRAAGKAQEAKYAFRQALAIHPEMRVAQSELLKTIGITHPLFALCWKSMFTFSKSNVQSQIVLLLLPIYLTRGGLRVIHDFDSSRTVVIPLLALVWLLYLYFLAARLLLPVALKRGWIIGDITDKETAAWERQHQHDMELMRTAEEAEYQLKAKDGCGARQSYLTLLRRDPDDQESQLGMIEAVRLLNPVKAWWWARLFDLLRFSRTTMFLLLFAMWVGVPILLFNDHAVNVPFVLATIISLAYCFGPALLRLGIRKGWFR